MQKQIPDHIVNADKSQRRKTQRTLTKVVKRAGFSESSHLSCIEPENKVYVTNEKPSDYRRRHNHINVNSKHNMVVPWLGPASKSLIANIQSSRIYDTFRRSIKKTEDNDACKDSKSRVSMAIQDLNKSERVLNINSSLAASGPLLKTTIPNGYGKLTYPNGTVFIGEIENDLPNGHGKSLYFSGVVYEGDWKKGNREGKGKLTFSDGSYYEGAFLNKFHGQGKYVSPSLGIRYSSLFSAGNVYGEYSIQFSDGDVLQKTWPDARLSLHEAINKLVKEKKIKEAQKQRVGGQMEFQYG